MDYGSLLQLAKKNSDKKEVNKRALSSLPPPRTAEELRQKEAEKKRLLDANVAKFLAKRKDDERKKQTDANKKRGELLALRNQDSKARKRVLLMNKSAKSADKSAIQDAVGPGDYYIIEEPLCFMSEEALAQETKFLEKLCKGPAEEKFSKSKSNTNRDLNGTKDRVKLALKMGDTLDKVKTRESKDKSKEARREETKVEEEYIKPKEEKRSKKQHAPPPMNYLELLKLAEKLQQEPVKEAPREKEVDMRPMTAKQREEYLCEEASRKRKEAGWREEERLKKMDKNQSFKIPNASQGRIPKISSTPAPSSSLPRIPKLSSSGSHQDHQKQSSSSTAKKSSESDDKASSSMLRSRLSEKPSKSIQPESRRDREAPKQNGTSSSKKSHSSSHSSSNQSSSNQASSSHSGKGKSTVSSSSSSKQDHKQGSKSSSQTSKITSKDDVSKPRPLAFKKLDDHIRKAPQSPSPADVRPKKTLPVDVKSRPSSVTSRQFSPSNAKSRPVPMEVKERPATATNVKPRQYLPSDLRSKQTPPTDAKARIVTNDKSKQLPLTNDKSRQNPIVGEKSRQSLPADVKSRQFPPADLKSRPSDIKPRQFPPPDVKSRQFPPPDVKSRQFPPPDVKSRQFPPSDVRSKQFPPGDVRRRPQKPPQKRRIIESDEEYDSDVADFIDDGPEDNGQDYSKYIQEIFGYDKSRYRHLDDEDDRCMESSFAQQQKEEFTSAKLGILEDLEDIRKEKKREAMIKARKKARKK